MDSQLDVTLTQTFDRKPLATVRNLPGGDADLTPPQMRAIAAALFAAADECEARPMDQRHFLRVKRSYGVVPDVCGCHVGECESKPGRRCRMADEIKQSSWAQ